MVRTAAGMPQRQVNICSEGAALAWNPSSEGRAEERSGDKAFTDGFQASAACFLHAKFADAFHWLKVRVTVSTPVKLHLRPGRYMLVLGRPNRRCSGPAGGVAAGPQQSMLRALLDGRDVFLSVRTGGGKSLCYMGFPAAAKALAKAETDAGCRACPGEPMARSDIFLLLGDRQRSSDLLSHRTTQLSRPRLVRDDSLEPPPSPKRGLLFRTSEQHDHKMPCQGVRSSSLELLFVV
ncbi:hypothetical protein Bbelb_120400 [Branchiostoma belcheri]|nr:hypothetical protein Bbelb_120400 [Branchiostoma belcheri]